jgi:hypothetical protein
MVRRPGARRREVVDMDGCDGDVSFLAGETGGWCDPAGLSGASWTYLSSDVIGALAVLALTTSMALQGYGYGTHLDPVAIASPSAANNRIEYRRGALTEWYVNGPLGLEQGFTIEQRPDRGHTGPM